jgi:hypothetical protein
MNGKAMGQILAVLGKFPTLVQIWRRCVEKPLGFGGIPLVYDAELESERRVRQLGLVRCAQLNQVAGGANVR